MADYEGLIRVGIQGLGQLDQLNSKLEKAGNLFGNLENISTNVGQALGGATRNVDRAGRELVQARANLRNAVRARASAAQARNERGQYISGGGTIDQRRLASQLYQGARQQAIGANRNLREAERDRRLVAAANGRYARALNRTGTIIEDLGQSVAASQAGLDRVMGQIGAGSRGNYLTNLFRGRQQAFARGGAGARLSPELQQQARNAQAAWNLATAGGRENLRLMQRLATEMAGLIRVQSEQNTGRAERSKSFEAGRRGRERITDLSRMPGADPEKIRRLRSMTTETIRIGNMGDVPGAREAGRRMNVAISRYERELNAAAKELRAAKMRGGPRSRLQGSIAIPGSPAYLARQARLGGPRESIKGRKDLPGSPAYLEASIKNAPSSRIPQGPLQIAERVRALRESGGTLALPSANLLAERIARTAGGIAPTRLDQQKKKEEKAAAEETKKAEKERGRYFEKLDAEQKRQTSLGIGAPERIRAPGGRSGAGAIPLAGTATAPFTTEALGKAEQAARKVTQKIAADQMAMDSKVFDSKLKKLNELAAQELKLIGAKDKAELDDFDRRLKNRIEKQKASKASALFQGAPRKALSEGLIGGAFPLLFGQGIGASIGGAAGGFGGGMLGGSFGFGLSLAGTAVGAAVDTTAANLKDLAASLKSPNDTIQALEKSGYRVSDSLKFQVEQLQSVGRAYDAQTLVLQEVQRRLGPDSIRNLNALDTEQKRLQDQWSSIAGTLQSELLPALIGFANVINGVLEVARGAANDPILRGVASVAGKGAAIVAPGANVAGTAFRAFQEKGRNVAAKASSAAPALTPQEAFAAESSRIQESRKIADQIQSAYREAFNLQRQAHDLQYDGARLNRDAADYSYKKERDIFDLRQQVVEQRITNARGAAQNRIESGDLSARQAFAGAVGFEQQLLANVREVVRTRKEGEADIEQSRKKLELAMAKINRDVEDYKRTNAREIEDIERRKLSYVRSVEDYKMRVADYVRDRNREVVDLIKQAALLQGAPMAAGGVGAASVGGNKLSQLIGSRESYGGNYGAFNRGGSDDGHRAYGSGKDPNLVNMTIAEIQRRQLAPGVPDGQQLHAVGKYQIIGKTLRSLMQGRYGATGVNAADKFTPDVQEKLGAALARARVMGRSVEKGMRGLRQEWIGLQYVSDAKLREAVIEMQQNGSTPQAAAATTIGNIPTPKFTPTPIGPTPSAAPLNAANLAASGQLKGGLQEAQRILEDQNKLKLKGIELGQIEQILQTNQLPQLQQQGDALRQQIEARQKILNLSDEAASVADIQAEANARLKQIDKDRQSALAKAKKQFGNDPSVAKDINKQADLAVAIAKGEEAQRRKNLDLNNQLQNQDRVRVEILQLQETLAGGLAEAAALERGELQASNVERLKATTLYQKAGEAERSKLEALVAQTEELSKQNDFSKRINELRRETQYTGAGLRAGFAGAQAQAFEQGLTQFDGSVQRATEYAKQNRILEDQKLIWDNLGKSIADTSSAISGALTNGLVDIVGLFSLREGGKTRRSRTAQDFENLDTGEKRARRKAQKIADVENRAERTKKIQDVGRQALGGIARSFADPAQQQLGNLLQRQLASTLGGPQGPLVKLFGAGTGAVSAAGPQALGSASAVAAGQVAMFGAALQAIAGQMAFSGALGNMGSAFSTAAPSLLAGFGQAAPNLLSSIAPGFQFGGFLANGGTARPGRGYVVGENEPEFFFPGVSGRVVPQSDMEKAANLAKADSDNSAIDVSYTVIEQRGERYVTEDQFRKANAALLQKSQAMTYSGMRNNRGVREYVGI